MTIATIASKTVGRGNGVTTAFTYSFLVPTASSLRVTHVDADGVEQVLSSAAYSVSGIGERTGGTVTYPLSGSPLATGESVVIERVLPMQQLTTLRNQGGYYPASVEEALDYLMMVIQQVAGGAQNYPLALTFPTVDVSPDTELPPAGQRAGMFMGFDANGNPLMLPASGAPGDLSPYPVLATGSTTARALAARFSTPIDVRDFGAACDDTTDDTAAIQAAINSVGDTSITTRAGPVIVIPGPCRITGTLTIRRKAIVLEGLGWGFRDDTGPRRSYLRWDGAAGIPMVAFTDCLGGAGMRRLRLIGKVTAPPSAAIALIETNDGIPNQQLLIEQVYIGPYSGETGVGIQFVDGIQASGTNVNNAEHRINGCYIISISGKAIRQSGTQQLNWKIDHLTVVNAGTGIYVCGAVQGSNWNFANCLIDIEQPFTDAGGSQTNSLINVLNYYSEGAGRMLELGNAARVLIQGGFFQITSALNVDGKVVKHEGNTPLMLDMNGMRFTQASAPPAAPYFSLRAAAAGATEKTIIIKNVTGWNALTGGTYGLDVATRGPTDRRYIRFNESPQTAGGSILKVTQNFLSGTDTDWDVNRHDIRGNTACTLFDDFFGEVVDSRWNGSIGSDGACVLPTISSGNMLHGFAFMSTGADAGGTMALNGAQVDLGTTNFRASEGGLVFECRVHASAITNVALFVGFTDQSVSLEMPFTLGAGDVLTSNAADAVGLLFDTAADTDNWWLVGVANNVDAAKQNSGGAPTAFINEVLRVELDPSGTATFYRNGVKVGTAMTAAVTPATQLTPVVAAFSRGAASRNIFYDYILVEKNRY